MNKAAARLLELGHVPIIGMNAVLPVLEHANVSDKYKCTMEISLAVISACDALLLLAESPGANKERDLILAKDRPVFKSIDEIIASSKSKSSVCSGFIQHMLRQIFSWKEKAQSSLTLRLLRF